MEICLWRIAKLLIYICLQLSSHPACQPNNVIVTFYTAIQLSHLTKTCSVSLRFAYSPLIELKLVLLEFKNYRVKNYEGTTYALLTNSVSIPSKILHICGGVKTLFIPYRYYLGSQKEKYYYEKDISHRSLILSYSSFFVPNVINQYDMVILPPGLTHEERNYYKDFKKLWEILFNLYSPVVELNKEGRLIPLTTIKDDLKSILYSLCNSQVICEKRKSIFSKKGQTSSHLRNTGEEVGEIMDDLLFGWIIALIQTDLPFYLKFYVSFLCPR